MEGCSRGARRALVPATIVCVAALALTPVGAAAQARTTAALRRGRIVAAPDERRALAAVRTSTAPAIDGRLDDPAWRAAAVGRDFVQRTPDVLRPATQRTEVRILFDDAALYVAMRMFDSAPDSIVAPLARRDATPYSDWAEVAIDGYHDRRTAFRFMVNPAGVQRDALVSGDDLFSEDDGWDAVWSSATARDSLGWSAELRIPLSQLRFGVGPDATRWGLQVGRVLARRDERSYWSPIQPNVAGFVSQFGTLDHVTIAHPVRRAELLPYLSTTLTSAPADAANPIAHATRLQRTAGLDLRLGVTQDLTLTGTINPDFGQVEADPSEVNLTGAESFFAERRPFFLEGSDLFAVDLLPTRWTGPEQLLYTRRLGRAPQGSAPDGARWVSAPSTTPMLGALKLTGRTASGWRVAALGALTDEVRARYVSESGVQATSVVEPRTRYGVARVGRELAQGESALGGVVTFVDRDPTVPTLRSRALVGGLDARARFGDRRYIAYADVIGSVVRGSPEAMLETQRSTTHLFQRPDARYLDLDSSRTSLGGLSAAARITKEGGGHLRGGLLGKAVTPGFEANDLGLQPFADAITGFAWIGWDGFERTRFARAWEAWTTLWSGTSFGGDRTRAGARLFAQVTLHDSWIINGAFERNQPVVDLTALRGGPALATAGRSGGFVHVESDPRRAFTAQVDASGHRDDDGPGRQLTLSSTVTARVGESTQLSLAPSLDWWRNPQQYVASPSAGGSIHHVVGDLLQSTAALTVRASHAFSPRLTLDLYAQPFLSAGEYRALGEVTDPRAPSLAQRVRRFTPDALGVAGDDRLEARTSAGVLRFDRPDYAAATLNANAVLRWEYAPGSTLYVVWSQGRSADAAPAPFDLGAQTRTLLGAPPTNVLLVKVSRWLGK